MKEGSLQRALKAITVLSLWHVTTGGLCWHWGLWGNLNYWHSGVSFPWSTGKWIAYSFLWLPEFHSQGAYTMITQRWIDRDAWKQMERVIRDQLFTLLFPYKNEVDQVKVVRASFKTKRRAGFPMQQVIELWNPPVKKLWMLKVWMNSRNELMEEMSVKGCYIYRNIIQVRNSLGQK